MASTREVDVEDDELFQRDAVPVDHSPIAPPKETQKIHAHYRRIGSSSSPSDGDSSDERSAEEGDGCSEHDEGNSELRAAKKEKLINNKTLLDFTVDQSAIEVSGESFD